MSQSLKAGAERQVIALNTVGEYFACQMPVLQDLSSIATPVITGNHADVEWC